MRTTHPEIKKSDNLTIATGITAASHFFRRPQQPFHGRDPQKVSQPPVEPIGDSVELSEESLFSAPSRGEELCSHLLAAFA